MSRMEIRQLSRSPDLLIKSASRQSVSDSAVVGQDRNLGISNTTASLDLKLCQRSASECNVFEQKETTCSAPSECHVHPRKKIHLVSKCVDQAVSKAQTARRKSASVCKRKHTFSDKTDLGGKAISKRSLTDISKEAEGFHFSTTDKKTDLWRSSSDTALKRVMTKTILFLTSPPVSSCYAITGPPKSEKGSMDKKMRRRCKMSCKEKIKNKVGRSRLKVLHDEIIKPTSESPRRLKCCKSSHGNHSVSSKMSEPRLSSHRSRSGATPPHQSRKRVSVIQYSSWHKHLASIVQSKQSPKSKTFSSQISPSRLAKTKPNKNCYYISFSISPQRVLCKPANVSSSESGLRGSVSQMGFPYRCVGYENLLQADRKAKRENCSKEVRASSKHVARQMKMAVFKPKLCEDNAVYKKKGGVKLISKHRKEKCNEAEAISKRAKGDVKQIVKVGSTLVKNKEFQIACRKVSIRGVPCNRDPIQDIVHDGAVVLLPTNKQKSKSHKGTKKAKMAPKTTSVSTDRVKGRKQSLNTDNFTYRQKVPFFSQTSALWSCSSALKQPSVKSSAAPKNSNVRNAPVLSAAHSSVQKLRRTSASRSETFRSKTLENTQVKINALPQKPNLGITKPFTDGRVKSKVNSKVVQTRVDTKNESKAFTPAVRTKIIMKRPHTTICHYRNKPEKETDADSEDSFPLSYSKFSSCEMGNISFFSKSESSTLSGPNEPSDSSDDKACWSRYKNAAESVSSFTKFSSCNERYFTSGATRREKVSVLRGTLRLPAVSASCNKQRCNILHKHVFDSCAKKCILLPNVTGSHTVAVQSYSSCHATTMMPSLLSFFSCLNQTITAPIQFNAGPAKPHETPQTHPTNTNTALSANPENGRPQSPAGDNCSDSEKSTQLTENYFSQTSVLVMTDNEKIYDAKKLSELEENKLMGENICDAKKLTVFEENKVVDDKICDAKKFNMQEENKLAGDKKNFEVIMSPVTNKIASIQEYNKTVSVENCEANIATTEEAEDNAAAIKMTVKNFISFSNSSMSYAKSILRTGHIRTSQDLRQCGRTENINLQSKKKGKLKQDCNGSRENPSAALLSVSQISCRVLIFCVILAVVIVQVILRLYF